MTCQGPVHPGLEVEALPAPRADVAILVKDEWPRSDQAHLTPEDIEQLRQLVERVAPQPPPDARRAWIVWDLEHPRIAAVLEMLVQMRHLRLSLIGVRDHRAELEDPESSIVLAHPDLAEEHRPPRIELDRDGDQRRTTGARSDEATRRHDHVEDCASESRDDGRETQSAASRPSGRPSTVWMPTPGPTSSKSLGTMSTCTSRSFIERIRLSVSLVGLVRERDDHPLDVEQPDERG